MIFVILHCDSCWVQVWWVEASFFGWKYGYLQQLHIDHRISSQIHCSLHLMRVPKLTKSTNKSTSNFHFESHKHMYYLYFWLFVSKMLYFPIPKSLSLDVQSVIDSVRVFVSFRSIFPTWFFVEIFEIIWIRLHQIEHESGDITDFRIKDSTTVVQL